MAFSYADLVQRKDCLHDLFMLQVGEQYGEYCLNGKVCSMCNKYWSYSFYEEFGKEKEKILEGPIGPCLDCVSTGRESFRTNQCHVKHAVRTTRGPSQTHSEPEHYITQRPSWPRKTREWEGLQKGCNLHNTWIALSCGGEQ